MKAEVKKKVLVGAAILDRPLGGDLKFQERARNEGWQRETSPGRGYTKSLEAYSCGCLPHILYVLRSHILYTQILLVLEAVSSGIVTLSSQPYIPATVHTGLISLLTLRRPFNTRLTLSHQNLTRFAVEVGHFPQFSQLLCHFTHTVPQV